MSLRDKLERALMQRETLRDYLAQRTQLFEQGLCLEVVRQRCEEAKGEIEILRRQTEEKEQELAELKDIVTRCGQEQAALEEEQREIERLLADSPGFRAASD
jgi:hypothetical protein